MAPGAVDRVVRDRLARAPAARPYPHRPLRGAAQPVSSSDGRRDPHDLRGRVRDVRPGARLSRSATSPRTRTIERERVARRVRSLVRRVRRPDIVGTAAVFTMPMTVPGRRARRRVRDRGRRPADAPAPGYQHAADAPPARRRARARRARRRAATRPRAASTAGTGTGSGRSGSRSTSSARARRSSAGTRRRETSGLVEREPALKDILGRPRGDAALAAGHGAARRATARLRAARTRGRRQAAADVRAARGRGRESTASPSTT